MTESTPVQACQGQLTCQLPKIPHTTNTTNTTNTSPPPVVLLEICDLSVAYGAVVALENVNLCVNAGETVALIGSNGAGKTSLLRAISGLVAPMRGVISYGGQEITHKEPHQIVRLGVAHSPEGRQVLGQQSVLDNLMLGAYVRSDHQAVKRDLEHMFTLFPSLAKRRGQLAGTLSGGEQQMLAMGRALMLRPRLLLLDEPSLGLAPLVVAEIFKIILQLRETQVAILLVEQNAKLALETASRAYVLEAGQMRMEGQAATLLASEEIRQAYLGR